MNVLNPTEGLCNLDLVLSREDLKREGYIPKDNPTKGKRRYNFKPTKSQYSKLSTWSPIFSIDCERCLCEGGRSEVTSIAIVDEDLRTVYSTYVKPHKRIVDYRTPFSGITPKILKKVTTRLTDVLNFISNWLPSDAILVGHGLVNDLVAMRRSHPYIIDTAVIYNLEKKTATERAKKSSLKTLAKVYLNEVIQDDEKKGHCAIEDAKTTMKLVKLKLEKSLDFGISNYFTFVQQRYGSSRDPNSMMWKSNGNFRRVILSRQSKIKDLYNLGASPRDFNNN